MRRRVVEESTRDVEDVAWRERNVEERWAHQAVVVGTNDFATLAALVGLDCPWGRWCVHAPSLATVNLHDEDGMGVLVQATGGTRDSWVVCGE